MLCKRGELRLADLVKMTSIQRSTDKCLSQLICYGLVPGRMKSAFFKDQWGKRRSKHIGSGKVLGGSRQDLICRRACFLIGSEPFYIGQVGKFMYRFKKKKNDIVFRI